MSRMQEVPVQLELESLLQSPMPGVPIYTIGYGGRSLEQFISLLHKYNIEWLIDIRSQPRSRFNQQFSKQSLEKVLHQHQIRYLFMGDTLGGRPNDETCYVDGRVAYVEIRKKEFYRKGINRLRTAWEKQIPVALMCAELKPHECHRSKLIGNTLTDESIEVKHINEFGEIKSQEDINKLIRGSQETNKQQTLFSDEQADSSLDDQMNFSRKKYVVARKDV